MKNLDYLAGFFDGEGCISIVAGLHRKASGKEYVEYKPVVIVTNTKKEVLESFLTYFGGQIYSYKAKAGKSQKPYWQWVVTTKQAQTFCEVMKERLFLKREQADLVIELQATKTGNRGPRNLSVIERQKELLLKMRSLNTPKRQR